MLMLEEEELKILKCIKKKQAAMQSPRLPSYIVCLFTLFPFQILHIYEYIVVLTFEMHFLLIGGTFSTRHGW